jgi:NitT/TauT family transport system substrate-binding protein
MLANKLNVGVMGDYPLIVNGAKFQQTKSLRTIYVAGTGYNIKGSGNAVVVPVASDIYEFKQLKGKTISVPVGSAAWGMTLKALQDANIPLADITLKNQSPAVGAANIAASKIDAHADFCPWSELMEFRGTGRKIYDGSETTIPYLHGAVVRQDVAEAHPEVVVAFIKAIIDAGHWIDENPLRAAESLEKWTGVEKEVQYLYFSKGGHLTLDPTIKPEWVEALKFDHTVLAREQQIPPLDFDAWITDKYVRQAFKEKGLDYDKQVKQKHDPAVAHKGLPMEVWHARDGIMSYPDVKAFLAAVAKFEAVGQKLNATYVYDEATGLKLFGKMAFYVKDKDGSFKTFLRTFGPTVGVAHREPGQGGLGCPSRCNRAPGPAGSAPRPAPAGARGGGGATKGRRRPSCEIALRPIGDTLWESVLSLRVGPVPPGCSVRESP